MKRFIFALLLIFGAISFAHAKPHRGVTCTPGFLGCPPANFTPVPTPKPISTAPATVGNVQDLISVLTQFPAEIITNLKQADTYEALPINSATGQSWNITAHDCIVGMPGEGVSGQPGYSPPGTGLIGFIQGLPLVNAANSVPPLPGPNSAMCVADKALTPNPANTAADCTAASPATLLVYAQNQLNVAQTAIGGIVSQINSGGFPAGLARDCGGEAQFSLNQFATITAQNAAIVALFGKYVAPVLAAHKGPSPKS